VCLSIFIVHNKESNVVETSAEKPNLPQGAIELGECSKKAAQQIIALQPDLILLITPHGVGIKSGPTIYLNECAAGINYLKILSLLKVAHLILNDSSLVIFKEMLNGWEIGLNLNLKT
jgi:hypothetical protein